MDFKGRKKQIVSERIKKIEELRKAGIEPYPYRFERNADFLYLQKKYEGLSSGEKTDEEVSIAGRVIACRILGKISFAKLQDENSTIQVVFQENETPGEVISLFKKYVDIGDFIGVVGKVFRSKRGDLSVMVQKMKILSKALYPIPIEHFGLKNKEERFRKRHLDLIVNPRVREIFKKRSQMISVIRKFMEEKGFMEVETPLLQTNYGGASARPFKTRINAWDMDMYLSISPELYLKRLIIGGYEKVFTICKNFRNEGVDHSHNPEFTMLEAYQAYADYNDMMSLTEQCFEFVAKKVFGKTKFKRKMGNREVEIDFKAPWKKITLLDALKEYVGIDADKMSKEELLDFCKKNQLEVKEEDSWGDLVETIFEELVEEKIVGPFHIIDRPKEGTPLCKRHRKDKRLNEQCEPVVAGMEVGNIYSELNDPILQEETLKEQEEKGRGGDEEAHPMDKEFLEAIRQGMPPCGGLGWGIDRMVMLMTETESLREIIFFPTMKPEE
ncbi:lysine--tRNA ligase [Candidatus Pacearchaeota archaeon]|nr:MAG: lysine--tRNA ligase [Candidatus Pacearchaeota archaeon]